MMWLAAKILVYLMLALILGGAAGWLLARGSQRRRWQDQLAAARAEIFRIESEASDLKSRLKTLLSQTSKSDATATDTPTLEHSQRSHTIQPEPAADGAADKRIEAMMSERDQQLAMAEVASSASSNLISALHREITRLRLERAELPQPKNETGALELTVRELEGRLIRKMADIDRLEQTLLSETRKVRELERERDLQDKSLRVLHQQLEMERQPKRIAS